MTIIAFISQKGGVGKSTSAQALAFEAQQQKIKTLLADCDPQQATSYEWSKIQNKINCQVFKSPKEIWPFSTQYDLIIIDGPARTSQATQEIAERADLVFQPVGASRDDLVPAVKEFNALKKIGLNPNKLCFVLTRLSTPKEAAAIKDYLATTGYACSTNYCYEKASYKQTQNEGKAITEVHYKNLRQQARSLITNL
jgi:chromosome partitioning protein